jgi:undecaprenyl-diphosphatase
MQRAGGPRPRLTPDLAETVALGLLHGPAELLPVSSSGHVAALPWLLGARHASLSGEVRKEVEVALHAGTGLALALGLGPRDAPAPARRVAFLALATAPAALAGLALERPIEERLGTPAALAAGLLAGSAALLAADRAPRGRGAEDAGPADALALGLAQACALVPGVSRSAATLAAARARGFGRPGAARLSRAVGLPVLAGAAALKGLRLARRAPAADTRRALAAGAVAAFASTLAALPLARSLERDRALWPWAAYRAALAATLLAARARRGQTAV